MLRHYSHASIAISHGKFAGEMEGVALRNIKMDSRCIHAILLRPLPLTDASWTPCTRYRCGRSIQHIVLYPSGIAITLSIINIESTGNKVRRYCLRGMMAYILIAIVFVIGMFKSQSLHIGNMLYVMLGLFVASMAYFILIIRKETKARKQKLMENFGIDLIPYVRYSQVSIILLYFAAGLLPVAILFNTLLYMIGPLILLSVIFFVHTFIAMGYYITPKEVIPEENDAEAKVTEAEDMKDGKNTHGTNILTANRKMEIELALKKWCEEGFYKDYEVNIYSLATKLGYKKNELTEYFNQSEYTNFRTWLSDIRFNEAVRMMKANPEYSIDAISTECGFSSHTWIYRIFKQKRGCHLANGANSLPPSKCVFL